jgi:hypothetical protein
MTSAHSHYATAREHLMDELALVGMFVARALGRGRAQGWLDANVPSIEVTDEMLFERFRVIEARLAASERTLPMDMLRRRLELTLTEQRVLWTLLAYELDPRLRRLLEHLSTHQSTGVTMGTLLALLYDEAEGSCYVELAPGGHLDSLRLIDIESSPVSSSQRHVRIADRIVELASDIIRLDREIDSFTRVVDVPQIRGLVLETRLDEYVSTLLGSTLRDPNAPMIAIVGPEGAGRRTLAQNAIARAGVPLMSVTCELLPTSPRELARALQAIFREARLFEAAIVFENLDALLEDNAAARMRIMEHSGLLTTK